MREMTKVRRRFKRRNGATEGSPEIASLRDTTLARIGRVAGFAGEWYCEETEI
jgi:hypothetical protein